MDAVFFSFFLFFSFLVSLFPAFDHASGHFAEDRREGQRGHDYSFPLVGTRSHQRTFARTFQGQLGHGWVSDRLWSSQVRSGQVRVSVSVVKKMEAEGRGKREEGHST